MSSKANIFLELRDPSLKELIAAHFAGDWTSSWNLVDASRNPNAASTALVAIIDDERSASVFGKSTSLVFAGSPEDPNRYFQTVETEKPNAPEALFKAVKLAFAYRETTLQNIESLYPAIGDSAPLELMAQSLTARLHELQQLSDMRLSLIEQLPIGVLGIDDEGIVALANPKAIEILGMEDSPIWGLSVKAIFKGQADAFLADAKAEELRICFEEQQIILRKSPFLLEKRSAGTILTLLRP